MRTDVPDSQLFDAHELESRGIRELFEIQLLNSTSIYITPHNELDYNGRTWEHLPCKLSENGMTSTGEQSRPKFAFVNPEGSYSALVALGAIDGALLIRYQILLTDLQEGNLAHVRNRWVMSKTISLNRNMIVMELRSTMDGAMFKLPARSFYPPDFPHVTLR